MKNTIPIILLGSLLVACVGPNQDDAPGATSRPSREASAAARATGLDVAIYDHFGDGIHSGGVEVTLADLAGNSKRYDGKSIRFRGVVKSVCK